MPPLLHGHVGEGGHLAPVRGGGEDEDGREVGVAVQHVEGEEEKGQQDLEPFREGGIVLLDRWC